MKWQLKSNNSYLKIWRLTKEHIKRVVFTVGFTVYFRLRWYLLVFLTFGNMT